MHGGGNCRSFAAVAGWLALFLGIQVCWRTGGDMHLTSGAVQCRVLESLVYEWRSRMALGDSSPASWAGSDTGRLVAAIAEEGESAYLCLWFRRWSVG